MVQIYVTNAPNLEMRGNSNSVAIATLQGAYISYHSMKHACKVVAMKTNKWNATQ